VDGGRRDELIAAGRCADPFHVSVACSAFYIHKNWNFDIREAARGRHRAMKSMEIRHQDISREHPGSRVDVIKSTT